MEPSKVYFTNLRTTPSSNLLDKMERVVKRAGIAGIDFQKQFVRLKFILASRATWLISVRTTPPAWQTSSVSWAENRS